MLINVLKNVFYTYKKNIKKPVRLQTIITQKQKSKDAYSQIFLICLNTKREKKTLHHTQ